MLAFVWLGTKRARCLVILIFRLVIQLRSDDNSIRDHVEDLLELTALALRDLVTDDKFEFRAESDVENTLNCKDGNQYGKVKPCVDFLALLYCQVLLYTCSPADIGKNHQESHEKA